MPPPERPDGYTDEEWASFQRGYRTAMATVASMASVMSASASDGPPLAIPVSGPSPDQGRGGDKGKDKCDECGGPTLHAMGREGKFCPSCDSGKNRPGDGQEGT